MWKYLEALLTGLVDDPFLIAVGGLASFLIVLTVGAVVGFAVGAVLGRRSSSLVARWLFSPWVIGVAAVATMMLVGCLLSPAALRAVSSWVTSVSGGAGAVLGWWITFSAAGETAPTVRKANPFLDGDPNPFGVKDAEQSPFAGGEE